MRAKEIIEGGTYLEKADGFAVRTVNRISNEVVEWTGQTAYWNAETGRLETYSHGGSVHVDYFARDVKVKL